MTKQIIAVVNGIIFNSNPEKHTVNYDKKARQACRDNHRDWKVWEGTFKAVIGTQEECVEKLRIQVKNYLSNGWWELNPKDFSLDWVFTEIGDNNEFWIIPCMSVAESTTKIEN